MLNIGLWYLKIVESYYSKTAESIDNIDMIRFQIIILFMTFVICSFCGKDFVSLGRHSWRCKEKINHPNSNHRNVNDFEQTLPTVNQSITTGNYSWIKCNCGKKCKGLRGLIAHQRSCRVIEKLNGNLYDVIDEGGRK